MRWLAATGALALVACGGPSSQPCSATGSLEITLADTNSDAPLCGAAVTIAPESGGAAQPLAIEDEGGPGCYYFVAVPAGQYKLLATDTGYLPLSESVPVTTVGCVVDSPHLALELVESM